MSPRRRLAPPDSIARTLRTLCLVWIAACGVFPLTVVGRPRSPAPAWYVSLIDQLPPQGSGPAINGLDERRRGPIFNAALKQVTAEGKLPPSIVLNPDLSLPATVLSEPRPPAGARLLRIYLTRWSQTRLGGIADTEIMCRFYVEEWQDRTVRRKLGPFFARRRYDVVTGNLPEERWSQYQAVAREALAKMALALREHQARQ